MPNGLEMSRPASLGSGTWRRRSLSQALCSWLLDLARSGGRPPPSRLLL